MKDTEEWKDIKGYEGLYEISNLGRVKSLKYNKERLLKPRINKYGYLRVNLYKNGKDITYYLHRLVARAFLEDYSNDLQVNHINECKTDNRGINLEMCTAKYNHNFGTRNKRTCKPVIQLNLNGDIIKEYSSIKDAQRETGYSNSNISDCCNNKRNTAYGYKWEFKLAS